MESPLFISSVALHIIAALLFLSGRRWRSLLVLLLAGVALRYYFVGLDPFIHDWDERFHALVAKNLTHHWLMPTLIEHPILPYDSTMWGYVHVWLHKQPLFLWQMALSIQQLGATEFAVRLPSLIMTSLMIMVVYLMGKSLFDRLTGFIAAFMFSCYEPLLEMNSGIRGMDHNDIAFLFYVSLSVCAWIYFEQRGRRRYLLMMGLFAGCAVLCKWLTGLLVFSGFGLYHLFFARDLFTRYTAKNIAMASAVCLLTFLPWQLYILAHYPIEARWEYAYNSRHFYQVLEGHRHETWFYFHELTHTFKGFHILILTGILSLVLSIRRDALAVSVAFMTLLVYFFFTLAQTKLPSYTMVVAPFCILFIARSISLVLMLTWPFDILRYAVGTVCFCALFYFFIDYHSISGDHFISGNWQGQIRTHKMTDKSIALRVAPHLPPHGVVVGMGTYKDNIDFMFYTGYPAYEEITAPDYHILRDGGYKVIFRSDSLPMYARGDSAATLLKDYLR